MSTHHSVLANGLSHKQPGYQRHVQLSLLAVQPSTGSQVVLNYQNIHFKV